MTLLGRRSGAWHSARKAQRLFVCLFDNDDTQVEAGGGGNYGQEQAQWASLAVAH